MNETKMMMLHTLSCSPSSGTTLRSWKATALTDSSTLTQSGHALHTDTLSCQAIMCFIYSTFKVYVRFLKHMVILGTNTAILIPQFFFYRIGPLRQYISCTKRIMHQCISIYYFIMWMELFIYLLKLHAQTLYIGGLNAFGIFYQSTLG